MKIFGRELFDFKKKPEKMYDFAQHGIVGASENEFMSLVQVSADDTLHLKDKKRGRPVQKLQFTPKGIFEAKALNQNDFKINNDVDYLSEHLAGIKEKRSLLPKMPKKGIPYGGTMFAVVELESIEERLHNRLKLDNWKASVDKYPHTTSALINEVLTKNSNLRCKSANEFIPDFPKEAIEAMKDYNEMCVGVCGRETHFYVIADMKDFGEKNKRRDPILLAQSPFGFFWQILGAWDEEMMYLGDL